MALQFRLHLAAMLFWARVIAFAQGRYRHNQNEAVCLKRRLDNRASVRAAALNHISR